MHSGKEVAHMCHPTCQGRWDSCVCPTSGLLWWWSRTRRTSDGRSPSRNDEFISPTHRPLRTDCRVPARGRGDSQNQLMQSLHLANEDRPERLKVADLRGEDWPFCLEPQAFLCGWWAGGRQRADAPSSMTSFPLCSIPESVNSLFCPLLPIKCGRNWKC